MKTFIRLYILRQYYENVYFQYQIGYFYYSVSGYTKIIQNRKIFANYIIRIYKKNIRIRTILKKSIDRGNKPEKLFPFIL